MLKRRRRFRRIGKGDLALQRRVEQILVAIDLDVADQILIDHDHARDLREVSGLAVGALQLVEEGGLLGRAVGLEEFFHRFQRRLRAAPHDVAKRVGCFGFDAFE